MHISQHEDRIVIDCSVCDYAGLIAAARDIEDQAQLPHVARPVRDLLVAHAEYAGEILDGLDRQAPPLVLTGQGSYRRRWPAATAELVGRTHAAALAGGGHSPAGYVPAC